MAAHGVEKVSSGNLTPVMEHQKLSHFLTDRDIRISWQLWHVGVIQVQIDHFRPI
jgi:hypothetical protein